jgi:hypothetical protein
MYYGFATWANVVTLFMLTVEIGLHGGVFTMGARPGPLPSSMRGYTSMVLCVAVVVMKARRDSDQMEGETQAIKWVLQVDALLCEEQHHCLGRPVVHLRLQATVGT